MQDIKDQIQAMLDEISASAGTPRFDLSEDDGCTASFGEGMMVRVQLRPHIPELDFTVPLGSVPEEKRAAVYGALLASNFYWAETHGATLALEPETEEDVLLQVDNWRELLNGLRAAEVEEEEQTQEDGRLASGGFMQV